VCVLREREPMKPDIKMFDDFLWWCYVGLAIGAIMVGIAILDGCSSAVDMPSQDAAAVMVDAGEDTKEAAADVAPDAHTICCQVMNNTCQTYIYGCVFTCGKAANGLTDVPWLAYEPDGGATTCQEARFGWKCHAVTGDGLIVYCQ
jgi:hypothetical protein